MWLFSLLNGTSQGPLSLKKQQFLEVGVLQYRPRSLKGMRAGAAMKGVGASSPWIGSGIGGSDLSMPTLRWGASFLGAMCLLACAVQITVSVIPVCSQCKGFRISNSSVTWSCRHFVLSFSGLRDTMITRPYVRVCKASPF